MLNGRTGELKPIAETGHSALESGRAGFEMYEKEYHRFDRPGAVEKPEGPEADFLKLFRIDAEEIRRVAGAINSYVEEKLAGVTDLVRAGLDEIFDKDRFAEIMRPYGLEATIPAICCWDILKETLAGYCGPDTDGRGGLYRNPGRRTPHEVRVRAVTELLLLKLNSAYPPAMLVTVLARWGYQTVTGREPELLKKIDETVGEKLVAAADAALYLGASAAIGAFRVVEDALEYAGASLEFLLGHEETAEKILSLDISGNLKAKLDKLYGRDDWARAFSGCVERFGTTAAYLGLTVLLSAGVVPAVAGGVGLALGKAGETTKRDIEKTGELTEKELLHGAVSGALTLALALLSRAAVEKLSGSAPEIAKTIREILGGKADPRLLNALTKSVVSGVEAGITAAAYDTPEQISKELERALDIDPDAGADWTHTLKAASVAMLTAAVGSFLIEMCVNRGVQTYDEISDALEKRDTSDMAEKIEKQDRCIGDVEDGRRTLDSTLEKGNYGEMKTDQYMRDREYRRISGDMVTDLTDQGHQGLDGVYFNPDKGEYVIADSKFGTAQLADTLDGKQMSAGWIDSRLDEAVGKELADEIRMLELLEPDKVRHYVAHVDIGKVLIDELNELAAVIRRDVEI